MDFSFYSFFTLKCVLVICCGPQNLAVFANYLTVTDFSTFSKLLKPTFPPSPYIALTPHTPAHLLSLGWRIRPIKKVSALVSRVGWTPAAKNERKNEHTNPPKFTNCNQLLSVKRILTECTSYDQTRHQYYSFADIKNIFNHRPTPS